VAVERNVEVVVARDCGDLPASTLVVSTAVLVLVDSDWAAAAEAGLLPACRGFWDVVLEWRADSEDGVDESVPSSSELGAKADGSSKVVVSTLADGLELV
jgi:hypothetical protein